MARHCAFPKSVGNKQNPSEISLLSPFTLPSSSSSSSSPSSSLISSLSPFTFSSLFLLLLVKKVMRQRQDSNLTNLPALPGPGAYWRDLRCGSGPAA